MENLENNAWVFDSLVGFLHGPVWNIPLQTFIEEKSLRNTSFDNTNVDSPDLFRDCWKTINVSTISTHTRGIEQVFAAFEPTDDGEVLDRPEYKKIHDEYRNLVDVMLGSFMDDIGITADQFEGACRLSAHDLAGLPSYFHKRLFEQIWAANDYEMFVKMMTHKNVELQLQALELIEKRFGVMPSLFTSEPEDSDSSRNDESFDWPDNDDVMTEIKKLELNDFDVKDEITVPQEQVVAEKQTLLTKLQHIENKEEKVVKKVTIDIPKVDDEQLKKPQPEIPKNNEVTEEDIRIRQEYLKQQRDKLLAMKKQVREKKLGAIQTEVASGEGRSAARPRSARAAQAALAGSAPPPATDAMQLRRALASKLKAEVVDKH